MSFRMQDRMDDFKPEFKPCQCKYCKYNNGPYKCKYFKEGIPLKIIRWSIECPYREEEEEEN